MFTRRILFVAVAAIFSWSFTGAATAESDDPLPVVATFSIVGDMAARIGGKYVSVTTLVGHDGDSHVYQPTPADAKAVSEAKVVIVNGLEFEGWFDRLIDASDFQGDPVVATLGVNLIAYDLDDHSSDQDHDDHGHADDDAHDDHGHAGEDDHDEHAHDDEDGHDDDAHDEHGHADDDAHDDHGHAGEDDHDEHAHDDEDGHDDDAHDEHGHADDDAHDDHGHADDDAHDDHGHAGEDDHDEHAHDDEDGHDDDAHDEHGHAEEDDHMGHEHHHGEFDPHAWQSLTNALIYVENIAAALVEASPQNADAIIRNRDEYLMEITDLDAEVREMFSGLPEDGRTVVTSHDALQYFGRAYGLTFVAPQGASTESEVSAKDLAHLIEQIRAEGIRAMFIENIGDSRLLERIADETGTVIGGTLYTDALSDMNGPASTYLDMMRHNATTIAQALTR